MRELQSRICDERQENKFKGKENKEEKIKKKSH